ncbi:Multidrug resistance protein [Candidatus Kryptobacter tengchongensis]|uniref:Multidrug resistance protein n=1 Tax=Kryptobacter tengchongensis TaxID=1643429 RepID=A0A656DG24_KRYT1|nr:MFS transporter [Candidatus Kryptobacter tengchongensis]CUS96013.1 Multidrug resistance protein [Candidatus Kryptobacter tengchongensis]CUU04494.1 Multidrug resistance protein [Candidatus Kryptobacter tengchongensis]
MRNRFGVIFLTVLIDLIGFGIVIPLLPFYALSFGAKSYQIGLLVSSFSFMQFIFNPIWGRISDKIGRRPVILISVFGSFVSYLIFAFANSLFVLFLSRMLAGLMGANIATAQAYIADITPPEERAKGMGIVGAGFGIGFVVGPFIGGILSKFGYNVPILFASGLSLLNFILAYKFLPEPKGHKYGVYRSNYVDSVFEIARDKILLFLYFTFFVITFGISINYVVFPLFTKDMFDFDASHNGLLFGYIGMIGVLTQGYLVGKLTKKFKEEKILVAGTFFMGLGLLGMVFSVHFSQFLIFATFFTFGSGITTPSVLSLISRQARAEIQGVTLGFGQSLSSLARVFGPSTGGFFYGNFGHKSPFILGAMAMSLSFLLAIGIYNRKNSKSR